MCDGLVGIVFALLHGRLHRDVAHEDDEVTDEELQTGIQELKNHRSCDNKGLVAEMLKEGGISLFEVKATEGKPQISNLADYQGWREIEVTIDSGACDTVMPLSMCSEIILHESDECAYPGNTTVLLAS